VAVLFEPALEVRKKRLQATHGFAELFHLAPQDGIIRPQFLNLSQRRLTLGHDGHHQRVVEDLFGLHPSNFARNSINVQLMVHFLEISF
jgi:hypothetical protein